MTYMAGLSITITEQPTEYHRFRYETEVTGGKLGGLLYGRHGNKSCVRIRVTGIDPLIHNAVIVIGGTVNPDGVPHPYFMVGEHCSDGAFQFKKDVSSLGEKREIDISLEKVSLICVSTKGEKLAEAIANRKKINFNPCNKDMESIKYNPRNLKSVRLVFQVYYQSFDNQPISTSAIVISDTITDAKQEVKMGIFGIHPNMVPLCGSHEIWIYFDEQLPHTDHSLFEAEVRSAADGAVAVCRVKEARKHLLVVVTPDLTPHFDSHSERFKCQLVIKEKRASIVESHDLILSNTMVFDYGTNPFLTDEAPAKRKRAINRSIEPNMMDFLSTTVTL